MFAVKDRFDEKTRFTRPEIQVSVTSKSWRDSGRAFFSPSHQKSCTHRVNQSKNTWCKQEQQILNSRYCKKQWRIQTRQMRGRGVVSHPDPEMGGGVPKKIFQPLGPQFGLKIRGDSGPPGPSLGCATEKRDHFFKGNYSSRFFSRLIFISARIELLKCLSS